MCNLELTWDFNAGRNKWRGKYRTSHYNYIGTYVSVKLDINVAFIIYGPSTHTAFPSILNLRSKMDEVLPSCGLKSSFHWLGLQWPQLPPPHITNAAFLSSEIVSCMMWLFQPSGTQIIYENSLVYQVGCMTGHTFRRLRRMTMGEMYLKQINVVSRRYLNSCNFLATHSVAYICIVLV